MDREARQAPVHGVTKSWTRLKQLSVHKLVPGEGNSNLLQYYCLGNSMHIVLLPGKSRGQRSLVGCSPWGHD